jgi:parallel beta-helix repeat protein
MEIKGIRIDCSSGSPPQALRCTGEDSVVGATATIEDNEIFGNTNGLTIFTDAIVSGNDIHDNDVGVTVTGASPILEGNTIGSNQVGLQVSGAAAEPSLASNVICDNETNVNLLGGAELADTTGNDICEEGSAATSD